MKLIKLIGIFVSLVPVSVSADIPANFHGDVESIAFEEAAARAAMEYDGFRLSEADLTALTDPGCQRGILPEEAVGMKAPDDSRCSNGMMRSRTNTHPFKAETDGYGQLQGILEANDGAAIDSLVVVGPMDKSDFKAIWDCAVYGNLLCLNL